MFQQQLYHQQFYAHQQYMAQTHQQYMNQQNPPTHADNEGGQNAGTCGDADVHHNTVEESAAPIDGSDAKRRRIEAQIDTTIIEPARIDEAITEHV